MSQPFQLKFIVDLAEALGQVKSFADGMSKVTAAVAAVGEVSQTAGAALETAARATAQGAEAAATATAAHNGEAAELARLTELLGSESAARASLAAQIIDTNATTAASEAEVAASLQRRAEIMVEVVARQAERLARETETAQAAATNAGAEAAAQTNVAQATEVTLSTAARAAVAKADAAEAARTLKVQIEDLARAQRSLAEIEREEPQNLALIARAQAEVAAEAQRVAEAERTAAAAKTASAEASKKLATEERQAEKGGASFAGKAQELGQMLAMLGLIDPPLLRVGMGMQMLGQAAETLGPKIEAAGGGLTGLAAALGPVVVIGAAATVVLGGIALAAEGVKAAVEAAIPAQESETSFAILLGNTEKARQRLEELDATALKFHLDPGELRSASEQLTRLSQGVLGSGQSLDMVIEASARSGKSLSTLGTIFGRLYETIESGQPIGRMGMQLERMGVLSANDINHLANLQKEGAKGPEIWAAAEAALSRYDGAAEARANTFQGAVKGIKGAWEETLVAFGRPITDALTPVLQSVAGWLPRLVPLAAAAGNALRENIVAPLGVLAGIGMTLVLPALNALRAVLTFFGSSLVTAGGAVGVFRVALFGLGTVLSVVGAAVAGFSLGTFIGELEVGGMKVKEWGALVVAGVVLTFNQVKNWVLDIGAQISAGLASLFNAALAKMAEFAKEAAHLINQALPANAQIGTGWAVKLIEQQAGTQAEIDGALAKRRAELKDKTRQAVDDFNHDVDSITDDAIQRRANEAKAKTGAPNEGVQFTPLTPGDTVVPDKKGKGGSVGARQQEVDEGSEAEKHYQMMLSITEGKLGAGDISQQEADAENIETTRDYIANLTALQAKLSPTSEKYREMEVRIDAARASLLKLGEGQGAFQAKLDASKAAVDAGIISQAQADARDNATITAQIGRLRQLQATVNQTSAAYQKLETEIDKLTAQKQQTTALGQITATFRKVITAWGSLGKNAGEWVSNTMNSGISAVSQGLTGLITKTGDWKQTMLSAVDAALEGLIELGIKTVAHYALMGVMMLAHKAVGTATTQATVAEQTSAGSTIAAAHAPAAAATSVSSYGVAAVVGAVLAIAAIGAIIALLAGGFAEGGLIPGSPSHSDNRLAHVATGEYVVRTAAVQFYGADLLHAINSMAFPLSAPAYAAGGLVGAGAGSVGGGGRGGSRGMVNKISVGGARVTLIQPNTRSAMHEAMQSAKGDAIIIDAVARNKHVLGIRT